MSSSRSPLPDSPTRTNAQPLVGYRSNEEWNDLVAQVGAMVAAIDDMPDEAARSRVLGILQGIDEIHREGLHRLVRLFKDGVLEQVISDPAIRTLMGMYDLLPKEEPGCTKTVNFLTDEELSQPATASAKPPRPAAIPAAVDTVPTPAVLPHWLPAPLDHAGAERAFSLLNAHGVSILVARVHGEDYAVEAACPHHSASLEDGRLSNYTLICPTAPGCAYDIRNGARIGGGPNLECHPTRRDDQGRVLIGFGMPFKPNMPSF